MLMTDQHSVDICHGESGGGERTLQPPHANSTVD